jgi:8-oxo-dGTP diphosphatase
VANLVYNLHLVKKIVLLQRFFFMQQKENLIALNSNISVDCVIFGFHNEQLKVLLIERHIPKVDFFDDTWVLPGDLIKNSEDLNNATERVLFELTGLKNITLEQIGAFGHPERLNKPNDKKWLEAIRLNPNARVITIGYTALIDIKKYKVTPSGFAQNAVWVSIDDVVDLGFDHLEIFQKALETLRNNIFSKPIVFELLPEKFTLKELMAIYQIILGTKIDKRNFRRKMINSGWLINTDQFQEGVAHKPAQLFCFKHQLQEEFYFKI